MQVAAIAVELRPRLMHEAADLGVRMVQAHARSIWGACWPVFAFVFVLALASAGMASWLPYLLIFWLKPWLDRSVLFVLARAVFGQATSFDDLWRAKRQVWGGSLLSTLTWRRLSPWRAFTQPIYQLEGQRGSERRRRRVQLLNGQHRAAMCLQAVFAHIEFIWNLGIVLLLMLFASQDSNSAFLALLFDADEAFGLTLLTSGISALIVAVLEPFYVAAGFAMYLNRRVQLEAWDIEQEFRRAF